MKNNIKLSIIFPFLNASIDVEAVFLSISAQQGINKQNMEVIVVDDGSSDDTLEVVKKHRYILAEFKNITIISHKNRLGLAQTRYDGALNARGNYITFVDKKTRPDSDYLSSFLSIGRNIIIGNVYINKNDSLWARLLCLVRMRVYYPYFNHSFKEINLDSEAYRNFRNKGGGGAMFVLRDYFLRVASEQKRGIHVNDDSLLIENLARIEPILKSPLPKARYINRTGFVENIVHLYNRGPKFIDYYITPGTRFFPHIVVMIILLPLMVFGIVTYPEKLVYTFYVLLFLLFTVSFYLSEDVVDFIIVAVLLPIAMLAFCLGLAKGLIFKVFRLY